MAKFISMSKDLNKLMSDLRKLQVDLSYICGKSVYRGAGYMADKIKAALEAMPTVSNKYGYPLYMPEGQKAKGISAVQKRDVIEAMGITHARKTDGFIEVKIGFDGYGSYETESYPRGIPNQLLMRSLEKGTPFLERNPVVTRTVKREKAATEKELEKALNNEIEKELK